jgi:hypothetical protein
MKSIGSISFKMRREEEKQPKEYIELINSQATDGYWSDRDIVTKFFVDVETQILFGKTDDKVILTIMALHILHKKFDRFRNEWKMIAKKANKWLND